MRIEDFFPTPIRRIDISPVIPIKSIDLINDQKISFEYLSLSEMKNEKKHPSLSLTTTSELCKILKFVEEEKEEDNCLLLPFLAMHILWYCVSIHIDDARNYLKDLYALFSCYKAIVWDVPLDRKWIQRIKEASGSIHNSQKAICQDYVDLLAFSELATATLSFYKDEQSGKIQEFFHVENKYTGFAYQLFLYIVNGDSIRENYEIAYCKECGEPFKRQTKKKVYCDNCGKPQNRTKRCRRSSQSKE